MDAQIIAGITFALLLIKMADKMAVKCFFYHNLCISSADLITILGESFSSC